MKKSKFTESQIVKAIKENEQGKQIHPINPPIAMGVLCGVIISKNAELHGISFVQR